MPSLLACALQEGGRAWRRAALVPLRLLVLFVGLMAVFMALAWNLVSTRDLLQKQLASTQFMGQQGWRLGVRPDTVAARGLLRLSLADSPALHALEQTQPGLWLVSGLTAIRSPQSAAAQHHGLAFANVAAGLSVSSASGEIPCVWLGPRAPQGDEWIVEQRLRCRVLQMPQAWQSLASEIELPTLVLPIEAASLAKGQGWRRSVDVLLLAGRSPCYNSLEAPSFSCISFAANRSAQADAAQSLGRWNAWVLPSSLVVALLAVLIYLQGLKPVLKTEFALRMAVGATGGFAARWLAGAVLAQLGWVMLGLALPIAALTYSLQVSPSRNEVLLCTAWAAACYLLGVAIVVIDTWRTRQQGLLKLGRLD